ncbi:MAG TPA: bacteriocin [Prolixibacteraceae bacterium]|nr:bacteriocin [Prolixibacteraceae bacterium]
MKELDEKELREVDGGLIFDTAWFACHICELLAGFKDGYDANKR